MINRLLSKSPARRAGECLADGASRQARSPAFYALMGAPDTVEGRFELMTLHVILLIDRLKDASPQAESLRQTLFDAYLSNLDGALREMGVGDLSVGKRMRKLGEAFYGRAKAYDAAFQALPDREPLETALARIVLAGAPAAAPQALAAYVIRCRDSLRAMTDEALMSGAPDWPQP